MDARPPPGPRRRDEDLADDPLRGLVDLVLVDTRFYGRDRQVTDDTIDELDNPDRGLLGAKQDAWLADQLNQPGATWLLLANQVVLMPPVVQVPPALPDEAIGSAGFVIADGNALNPDQWDGYPPAQTSLLNRLAARPAGGVVVLTGDIHCSMALENPAAGGQPPAVTEVVTPAVTTTTLGERLGPLADRIFDF